MLVSIGLHVGNLYDCFVSDLLESYRLDFSRFILDCGVVVFPLLAKEQSCIEFFNLLGILVMMLRVNNTLPFRQFKGLV